MVKYERNGLQAKWTVVTYFARDPMRSYFDECQKNEIYFLNNISWFVMNKQNDYLINLLNIFFLFYSFYCFIYLIILHNAQRCIKRCNLRINCYH